MIQEGDGVTQRTVRDACNGRKTLCADVDFLFFGNDTQPFDDLPGGNAAKLIALTAGDNRRWQALRLGGRQNKNGMGRRLFQGF